MTLSKRERVIRTLELDGEPDMVPIHYFGFEQTGRSFQSFKESGEKLKSSVLFFFSFPVFYFFLPF